MANRNPAFVGDAWSFWVGPIQIGDNTVTGTTPGLVVSASVILNNEPWGGPYLPTYDVGLRRWSFALELPGPGEVVVRWLVTYAHPTLGPIMKTSEQSLYVESRKPPVVVVGQSNLDWDVGPQGPPGIDGAPGPSWFLTAGLDDGSVVSGDVREMLFNHVDFAATQPDSDTEIISVNPTTYYTKPQVDAAIAAATIPASPIFDAGTLTISGDTITLPAIPTRASRVIVKVDTEGGAATDNLTTINVTGSVPDGMELVVGTVNSARDVTLVDSATLQLQGNVSIPLTSTALRAWLEKTSSGGVSWIEKGKHL